MKRHVIANQQVSIVMIRRPQFLTNAGSLWKRTFDRVASEFDHVATDYQHVDAAAMFFITNPDRFDVVVTDNLFGDILSDLGPACTGTIGVAPSGNISPTGDFPSLFEPVHGSAPDIAGQGIANPSGMILSVGLMFEHSFARPDLRLALDQATAATLAAGIRTPDIGGEASTAALTDALLEHLEA